MDKRFRLPLAEGSTTVFQTTAASDGLYWAEPAWYRYFGDDVAGESAAIIDGTFSVAKDGLPLKPIFSEIILRLRTILFVWSWKGASSGRCMLKSCCFRS
jgi:hypothetical protein